MLDLFKRAEQGLPLTPVERALRRFVVLFLTCLGPIGSVPVVTHIISSVQAYLATGEFAPVPWHNDLVFLLYMALITIFVALHKWFTSQRDDASVQAVDAVEQAVVKKLPDSAAWDARYQQAIQDAPVITATPGVESTMRVVPHSAAIGNTNNAPFTNTGAMTAVAGVTTPANTPTGMP